MEDWTCCSRSLCLPSRRRAASFSSETYLTGSLVLRVIAALLRGLEHAFMQGDAVSFVEGFHERQRRRTVGKGGQLHEIFLSFLLHLLIAATQR
jgi:hypothetical protein